MRILLALFVPCAALAQASAGQPAIPPPLRQLVSLVGDYGNAQRYAGENAAVKPAAANERRVVFMGDSITDNLHNDRFGGFFPGKPYLNRGISGQTTAQMVLRFYPDVIALEPRAVLILAGTNDIGGNLGPVTLESIENNLAAMTDIARAHGIKVVLASLTPVCDIQGRPAMTTGRPPEKILALNRWIKDFAARQGYVFLDYFAATEDANGLFRSELTDDGLHPNAKGYAIMNPLAEKAISQALGQ